MSAPVERARPGRRRRRCCRGGTPAGPRPPARSPRRPPRRAGPTPPGGAPRRSPSPPARSPTPVQNASASPTQCAWTAARSSPASHGSATAAPAWQYHAGEVSKARGSAASRSGQPVDAVPHVAPGVPAGLVRHDPVPAGVAPRARPPRAGRAATCSPRRRRRRPSRAGSAASPATAWRRAPRACPRAGGAQGVEVDAAPVGGLHHADGDDVELGVPAPRAASSSASTTLTPRTACAANGNETLVNSPSATSTRAPAGTLAAISPTSADTDAADRHPVRRHPDEVGERARRRGDGRVEVGRPRGAAAPVVDRGRPPRRRRRPVGRRRSPC